MPDENGKYTDHDLLVRLDERMDRLLEWTGNHEKRHAKAEGRVWAALLAGGVAVLAAVLGYVFR